MSKLTAKLSENKSRQIVLEGTVHWAHVHKVNEMSGKYQVDLSPTEQSLAALKESGVPIKNNGDARGDFVTLKVYGKNPQPPKVVDSKLNVLSSNINIGNGSKVKIQSKIFSWDFRGKKGIAAELGSIQVLELVEYNSKDNLLVPEEGYSIEKDLETTTQSDEANPFE